MKTHVAVSMNQAQGMFSETLPSATTHFLHLFTLIYGWQQLLTYLFQLFVKSTYPSMPYQISVSF